MDGSTGLPHEPGHSEGQTGGSVEAQGEGEFTDGQQGPPDGGDWRATPRWPLSLPEEPVPPASASRPDSTYAVPPEARGSAVTAVPLKSALHKSSA